MTVTLSEDRQTVRLDVAELRAQLDARGWTAAKLHERAHIPATRTIQRWLRNSDCSPAGSVETQWRFLQAVAGALEVSEESLVIGAAPEAVEPHVRHMRVAATMGPAVFPELLPETIKWASATGFEHLHETFREARVAGHRVLRFRHWLDCERLLRDAPTLTWKQAREAASWCRKNKVPQQAVPELFCRVGSALGDVEMALRCGRAWMGGALQRGSLGEAIWVGEWLVGLYSLEDGVVEVSLLLAHALSMTGRPRDGLALLTGLEHGAVASATALLDARVQVELALVRGNLGEFDKGLKSARLALTLLESVDDDDAHSVRLEALMRVGWLAFCVGDDEAAAHATDAMAAAQDEAPDRLTSYMMRLRGVDAFSRGDIPKAHELFMRALEMTVSAGQTREEAIARLHLGFSQALAQDERRARANFEQALSFARAGLQDPLLVGHIHLNLAEFEFQVGRLEQVEPHVRAALRNLERVGNHPGLQVRALIVLAETEFTRGDRALAQATAKTAYMHACDAMNPLEEANALSLSALVAEDRDRARAFHAKGTSRLSNAPTHTLVPVRLAVSRRLAHAELAFDREAALRRLQNLRRAVVRGGIWVEQARIDRILASAATV